MKLCIKKKKKKKNQIKSNLIILLLVILQYLILLISNIVVLNPLENGYPYFKKKLYGPFFHGWGSTASRLQPLRGGSLLFTIQFPEIPGTHFIDLGRMKG